MKKVLQKLKAFVIKHPILSPLIISILSSVIWVPYFILSNLRHWHLEIEFCRSIGQAISSIGSDLFNYFFISLFLLGLFMHYPIVLTAFNILFLFKPHQGENSRRVGHVIEYTTIIIGFIFTTLYANLLFPGIIFSADYHEQLYNQQLHTPIFNQSWVTLVTIACVALVGYLILRFVPLVKQPPLVTVLSMSTMYIEAAVCAVFIIQIFCPHINILALGLLPFNLIVITFKVIREITAEWKKIHPAEDEAQFGGKKTLLALNKFLCKAGVMPIAAFVLALPLLGVIIAVLTLAGQAPDAVIQAWTQTAGWNLSQQTAPPNIQYDEHYLCTVAAGGHQKVVKPLRTGKRHGHEVIVNRQLCVANAFEQLLEERTPHFHKLVRGIYDSLGYPIAKHIRTKAAADVVYIIMKPLEWIFLTVLYLSDTYPENRIAVQYPHAALPDKLRM